MWTNCPLVLYTNFRNRKINNMKNEIGRKITSLTLNDYNVRRWTDICFPWHVDASMHMLKPMRTYSYFRRKFTVQITTWPDAQVIEVVIIDSDINDTDEQKGEPDVDVNQRQKAKNGSSC